MDYLLYPDGLLYLLCDLLRLQDVLIEHLHQDPLGPLYYVSPLGGANVLDAIDGDSGNARPNPVNGLQSGSKYGSLDLIEA